MHLQAASTPLQTRPTEAGVRLVRNPIMGGHQGDAIVEIASPLLPAVVVATEVIHDNNSSRNKDVDMIRSSVTTLSAKSAISTIQGVRGLAGGVMKMPNQKKGGACSHLWRRYQLVWRHWSHQPHHRRT